MKALKILSIVFSFALLGCGDPAPSGGGGSTNAVDKAVDATTNAVGTAVDATTNAVGTAVDATTNAIKKAGDAVKDATNP